MKVVVKHPGQDGTIAEVKGFDEIRNIIDGWVEIARVGGTDLYFCCDEDGYARSRVPNLTLPGHQMIVGPVVFVAMGKEDIKGLNLKQVNEVFNLLNEDR